MRPPPLFQNHRRFSSFFRQIDLQDLYITLGSGLEFFVKGQAERAADLEDFFNEATSDNRRLEILRKYHVRWIVLNSAKLPPRVVETLMVPAGVVASVDTLTLLDAEVWARHLPSRAASDKATANPSGPQPAIVP